MEASTVVTDGFMLQYAASPLRGAFARAFVSLFVAE
jgi:hypothetical protein